MNSVVMVSGRAVAVTTHAVERYRMRVDRRASRATVLAVAAAGTVQRAKPGWVSDYGDADAWLVLPGARVVFPLRTPHERSRGLSKAELVATTCMPKRRLSKPDVRWARAQAAEDAEAA